MIQPKKYSKIAAIVLLTTMVACKDNETPDEQPATSADVVATVDVPAVLSYDIVNQYPHDPAAFTEGLEFKDGYLYESIGQYGVSDIRKTELTTGKVLKSTKMDARYFGEGMTILNGKIYQLTYKEGKGFVYDYTTLKQVATFSFHTPEGWGMTNNGNHLIFSDGSNIIYFTDPATGQVVKQLSVIDERGPAYQINELELIKGYIYANQWQTDRILKIDTNTGKVVARADLSDLRQRTGIPPISGYEGAPDVLNGIAYDAATNRIFITGKNWPKLMEVRLDN